MKNTDVSTSFCKKKKRTRDKTNKYILTLYSFALKTKYQSKTSLSLQLYIDIFDEKWL